MSGVDDLTPRERALIAQTVQYARYAKELEKDIEILTKELAKRKKKGRQIDPNTELKNRLEHAIRELAYRKPTLTREEWEFILERRGMQ